jgi:glycosyltransferase involved in cell wall biosynthesis
MPVSQRPHIAYLTPYAVLPANRGGRIRSHHLWRAMAAFGDVTPIMVGDSSQRPFRALTRAAGARFLPRRAYRLPALERALAEGRADVPLPGLWEVLGARALPDAIWDRLGDADSLMRHCLNPARIERIVSMVRALRPDLIVLCDSSVGLLAPHLKALGVPVVVGPHNYDSELYATMSRAAPTPFLRQWNEMAGQAFSEAERAYAPHVDQLWVCSAADARRFARHVPRGRIRVVPNVYDVTAPTPLPDSRDLVFVGQANYFPNEDAIHRLFTISRGLDARGVAHRMRIVGRIGAHMREAAKGSPSVEIVGEVPLVGPYIQGAAVVPVALTLGGGTRLKILEALASARPVLSTPIGIEGVEVEDGVHAVVEPDLANFPERIAELLADRERAQRIARQGWEFAREHYSHETLLRVVGDALKDLGFAVGREPAAATRPAGRPGKGAVAAAPAVPDPAVFAANIGATVRNEAIRFNPHTRLLNWSFDIHLAAGFDAVSAAFDIEGAPDLPNAFVTLKMRPGGLVGVEAAAILPAELAPEQAAITAYAWGRPVLRHRAPEVVPAEAAGLLTLQRDGSGIAVTGWSDAAEVALTPAAPLGASVPEVGPAILRGRLDGFGDAIALSLEPSGDLPAGLGQTLAHPAHWVLPRRPTSARLRAMRDRHAGETAWLVGNGPSVRIEDLDALQGKLTFSFNRFHLAYARTRLRPTYTVTGDKQMIEDFGQQIVDESLNTVFVAHDHPPALLGDYVWLRQVSIYPPLFGLRAEEVVSPGGSSLFVAMQVAYLMGVRRFYLYGADFRFAFEKSSGGGDAFRIATGEGNHFIANYRDGKPWCPPSLKDIGAGFHVARRVMEAEGGFVRNASRGGLMEMFPRQEFEAAVAQS